MTKNTEPTEEKEQLPLERQPLLKRLRFRLQDYLTYALYLILGGYVLYSLVASIYANYQSHTEITTAQARIAELKLDQARLQSLLVYYDTDSYKEIELRRRLLLKKPGETVVALKGDQPLSKIYLPEEETIQPAPWQEWYDFYFKPR